MALFRQSTIEDPDAPKSYRYEAVSPAGTRVKANMTAPSASIVAAALQEEGWIPISVEYVPSTAWNVDVMSWRKNRPLKLPIERVAQFARQFYQLLDAGVPIPRALESLGEEEEPQFALMCSDLSDKVAGGVPLHRALAQYPKCFDEVFIAYVSSGEATGTLRDTMRRLSEMLEKRVTLNKKIHGVTAYPKFVSIAIGLIVVAIMLWMVPLYAGIYKSFGAKLPTPTLILLDVSHVILPIHFLHTLGINQFGIHFGPRLPEFHLGPYIHSPIPPIPVPNFYSPILWIIMIWIGVKIFLQRTKDNPEIGIRVDKIRYWLPLFGGLIRRIELYRWASTLSGALDSGLTTIPALELAARASGSRWQRAVVGDLQDVIRGGRQLSDALQRHRELFPPSLRSMVTTGEQAGETTTMLDSVAQAVDDDIDRITSTLAAQVEVALIIVMGVVVGLILIALYLPIVQLTLVAGKGLSGGKF